MVRTSCDVDPWEEPILRDRLERRNHHREVPHSHEDRMVVSKDLRHPGEDPVESPVASPVESPGEDPGGSPDGTARYWESEDVWTQ